MLSFYFNPNAEVDRRFERTGDPAGQMKPPPMASRSSGGTNFGDAHFSQSNAASTRGMCLANVVVEHLAEERGVLGGGEKGAGVFCLRIWRQASRQF